VHAASVGEVASAEPLLRSLKARLPNTPLMVTTGTIGGKRMAELRLSEISAHVYLPIDFPGAVSRFLKAMRPKCALIMETELWFNLYKACSVSNVPVVVVNGRLSPRTLRAGSSSEGR
jgi:3-deoxy-D-manno-octulosonic-acid transferase